MKKAFTIVLSLVVIVAAIAAYMNVFSDDAAVRAQAEAVARKKVGCAGCTLTRMDGSRGVISEQIAFTFSGGKSTTVTCRRQYIAVGRYNCE